MPTSLLIAQQHAVLPKTDSASLMKARDTVPNDVMLLFNQSAPSPLTTASTQAVYNQSLIKSPVANVLNSLTGRLAGLYTRQNSGQSGSDGVSLTLRGRTPLIIIDGIPRPLTTIDLNEIESVTVIKDAMGAAMLGVRGANGAILITTRKGSAAQQEISFTAQTAFQQPLGMPQALNAFDYATLRNEAINNELSVNPNFGTGLQYSAADLQAFSNHSDPLGHPDVDWRKQILKSSAQLNRYTLNISGGSSNVRYFAALENLSQGGIFQTSDANKYDTNNDLSSYLIRSNVDIDLTPQLTGGIHLLGRILNQNDPGASTSSVFNSLLTTPNNAYPVLNPDGSYAGTSQFPNNIQGQVTGSGYNQLYTRDILADFYLKRTFNELTPGLYLKALVSYASNLNESINRSKPVVAYQATVSPTGTVSYGQALTVPAIQQNTNLISASTNVGQGQSRQSYLEASAGYDRVFNHIHGVDVVLLVNTDDFVTATNLPYNVAGLSGKVSYNYKQKYVAEFAAAYNGSNYYPTDSHYKFGFFPVAGLAWNITNEDFMKKINWLNSLKLSANYGKTGWDNPGYFVYIPRLNNGSTPYFGTSAGTSTSLLETNLANPNITWEKANKLDVSLQGSLISNSLDFTIDYYDNRFSDLLIQRGQNTSLLGISYPNENIGRNNYSGFDFQLSWHRAQSENFSYCISANAGLQQSKVIYSDEVSQPYPWMQRTGQQVGQPYGYIAQGLYQSQDDINNSSKNGVGTISGYTPQPGDIKYKDLNGDGIINQFDQAPIGAKGPLITYGVDLGFTYKNFDFSALIQGVANNSVFLAGNSYWEFQNNGIGQAYTQQLGRWTPATASTATYPRLSIGNNINNDIGSSYWYRRADFVRLKNLEMGFTLPLRYANAVKLKSLRIFVNGLNLFTVTQLKGGLDPEVNNGTYPIQKLVNLGISVKL